MDVLERERELDRLRQALEESKQGSGGVVVVEGPSGIGKTRLLSEARSIAHDAGIRVVHTRASELERDYAFGVVLGLLEPVLSAATDQERRQLLRGRAQLAAPLLGAPDDPLRPFSTNDERSLLHGLYWCVVNLAEQQPTALVIDDVHWADGPSLRFLVYLTQRLADLPLCVIAAIRTGDPTGDPELVARLLGAASVPSLRPSELSLDGTRELLARVLPEAVGEDFVYASWELTGGNPFLLGEIAAEVQADPEAWHDADAAQVRGFTPRSVGRNVALRLTRLGPDVLKLAQACAVLGDGERLNCATELAELSTAEAVAAAESLLTASILSGADPIAFSHPMIRAAVYDGLGPGRRAQAHADAALLLHREHAGSEKVAHHLLAGTAVADAWAAAALHEAGRAAARKGSPQTAVRYLRHALETSPREARNAALLVDLGLAEAAAGELTALPRFEEALGVIEEPHQATRALYALGQTLYRYGRHDEAAGIFLRGAQLAQDEPDEAKRFEGAFMCAAQYVVSLREELRARLRAQPDLRHRIPATSADRVMLANLALDTAMTVGDVPAPDSASLAERALGDNALLRAEGPESMAVNLAILALLWSGRPAAAQRAIEQVLADARERGAQLAFAEASMVRAMIMLWGRGQVSEAAADAQAAIQGMEGGWHSAVPAPQAVLIQCLIERGELDGAEAVLRAVESEIQSGDTRALTGWFHASSGRLRLARGDPAGALVDFMATGAVLDEYLEPVSPALIPWRSLAGLAMHAIDERDAALALIDEELQLARRRVLPAQLGIALRARGVVEGGAAAFDHLDRSVAALQEADSPLELARTLLTLGAMHRRSGARARSREPLRQALDLAHRCGASALAEHARDELLASGARPRRNVLTGVQSLTPSERRIAEQAATGRTARAIAEALFLSKHTVEWHLVRVYRKLDVTSRAELREQLELDRADDAA